MMGHVRVRLLALIALSAALPVGTEDEDGERPADGSTAEVLITLQEESAPTAQTETEIQQFTPVGTGNKGAKLPEDWSRAKAQIYLPGSAFAAFHVLCVGAMLLLRRRR